MASIKHWFSAARPRTLFLAVATVILGSGLALHEGKLSTTTFVLTMVLAISIQILSNLANDLGDYEKGTDITGKRQGPARTMQSGKITRKQMQIAIGIVGIFSGIIGITAVFQSLGWGETFFLMLLLGLLSIVSAVFYTMGKHAYGYNGLGDLFAFFFFGPVAVIGTYFLHTHSFDFQPVLPAIGMGFLSTMILNVNNMRDIENDKASGKITVASMLGLKNARLYHTLLTFGMFTCFLHYSFTYASFPWYRYIYAVIFVFQFYILTQIHKKEEREIDPYLKFTAISGFAVALFFSFCINI